MGVGGKIAGHRPSRWSERPGDGKGAGTGRNGVSHPWPLWAETLSHAPSPLTLPSVVYASFVTCCFISVSGQEFVGFVSNLGFQYTSS